MLRAVGGGYRASLNPVTKLAEFGVEGYVGVRGNRADAGTRALLQIPYLSTAVGGDYNVRSGQLNLLLTVHTPVRRGGFLTRGTLLRLDWYPTLRHSFVIGVSAPIGDLLAGRNRPLHDYVVVGPAVPTPEAHASSSTALLAELDSVAVAATWIRKLVVPFLDQDGRSGNVALARTARYVDDLRAHLSVRSVEAEVRPRPAGVRSSRGQRLGRQ